jgi:hypothetical protein
MHEVCLVPDDPGRATADRIAADLSDVIRVGARPLTVQLARTAHPGKASA